MHPQHRRFQPGHPENLCPFVRYAGVSGCLGYAIVWHCDKGWVNLGSVLLTLALFGMVWFTARELRNSTGHKDGD